MWEIYSPQSSDRLLQQAPTYSKRDNKLNKIKYLIFTQTGILSQKINILGFFCDVEILPLASVFKPSGVLCVIKQSLIENAV